MKHKTLPKGTLVCLRPEKVAANKEELAEVSERYGWLFIIEDSLPKGDDRSNYPKHNTYLVKSLMTGKPTELFPYEFTTEGEDSARKT